MLVILYRNCNFPTNCVLVVYLLAVRILAKKKNSFFMIGECLQWLKHQYCLGFKLFDEIQGNNATVAHKGNEWMVWTWNCTTTSSVKKKKDFFYPFFLSVLIVALYKPFTCLLHRQMILPVPSSCAAGRLRIILLCEDMAVFQLHLDALAGSKRKSHLHLW